MVSTAVAHSLPSILEETPESLTARLEAAGYKGFRAKQVMDWLYRKRVNGFEAMANLPSDLRTWLADTYCIRPGTVVLTRQSDDVTSKLLVEQGRDRALIETVLIRAPMTGVGQNRSRNTVCVSSQVGCAYGCKFCASGIAGFKRDLTQGEILGQFFHVCDQEDPTNPKADKGLPSFDNIVFMGMGEPLANYDAVVGAIRALRADWGFGLGARRITLSTSGLVPEIERLAGEGLGIRLAVSLHGATNDVRRQIMPINRKYPLEQLIPAIRAYSETNGRMVTLEYILIEEVNDTFEQAHALAAIARDLHAHVNCIPYNTVQGLPWKRPSLNRQNAFIRILEQARVSCTIRREKGHSIEAACGQLRLQQEKERGQYAYVR
ncbi:MAG: 23S rRNA (adenine(2503)-C(2))-methyltransferase RlmN [Opitutales bacterium]